MDQGTEVDQEKIERKSGFSHKNKRQSQASKHAIIINLKSQGVAPSKIADAVSMPVNTVKSIIQRFKPVFQELESVPDYRSKKADLLSAGQLAALKSAMSPKKLEKASFISALQGFEILNKAERLENNQSTENHNHRIFGAISVESVDTPVETPEQPIDITEDNK